jgi:hypothetical protein
LAPGSRLSRLERFAFFVLQPDLCMGEKSEKMGSHIFRGARIPSVACNVARLKDVDLYLCFLMGPSKLVYLAPCPDCRQMSDSGLIQIVVKIEEVPRH